jgi:hypothetical protein
MIAGGGRSIGRLRIHRSTSPGPAERPRQTERLQPGELRCRDHCASAPVSLVSVHRMITD